MSYLSSVLLIQKGLLAASLVVALVFLVVLARRLVVVQEEPRSSLLVDLLSNMSDSLERMEASLDDIAARASAAKSKLIKLNAIRSQLRPCALSKYLLDRAKKAPLVR